MGLGACIFQVRDSGGKVRGTGFAISPNLVVTSAHVVSSCEAEIGDLLSLFFYPEKIELKAEYYVTVGTMRETLHSYD